MIRVVINSDAGGRAKGRNKNRNKRTSLEESKAVIAITLPACFSAMLRYALCM